MQKCHHVPEKKTSLHVPRSEWYQYSQRSQWSSFSRKLGASLWTNGSATNCSSQPLTRRCGSRSCRDSGPQTLHLYMKSKASQHQCDLINWWLMCDVEVERVQDSRKSPMSHSVSILLSASWSNHGTLKFKSNKTSENMFHQKEASLPSFASSGFIPSLNCTHSSPASSIKLDGSGKRFWIKGCLLVLLSWMSRSIWSLVQGQFWLSSPN